MSDASTCRVATRTRSRSTHRPKGKKAVEHYLEYGRNIAATIKALGYPARDSLRAWIYEMHPELHTRVVSRSDGLARAASGEAGSGHRAVHAKRSAKALAQKLGVCRPTLYNWKTSYSAQRYPHP